MPRQISLTRTLPDPPPDLPDLRVAASEAVLCDGLNATARCIPLSPTGLRNLLNGSIPYAPTLRKLREWAKRNQTKDGGEHG